MEIIDLEKKRKERRDKKRIDKKDKDIGFRCKIKGSDGTYYKFSVTYQYKGKNWSFDIWAKTKREAKLRVFSIKQFPVNIEQILDEVHV